MALDRVPVRHAAARLDGRDVDARDVDVLRDVDLGRGQGGVGGVLVARFPVPDEVRLLVRALVGAQDDGARLEGLEGVDDHGQGLVVDVHGRGAVGSDVARGGHDRGHLLRLVLDGIGGQHHLGVAGQGRHPVQAGLLQVGAGDDGEHAGDGQRLGRVDALDRCVGIRAAHDVQPQHARQDDIVDVLALATDEARVLLALDGVAHAPDFGAGDGRLCVGGHLVHLAAAAGSPDAEGAERISAPACAIALTMFT